MFADEMQRVRFTRRHTPDVIPAIAFCPLPAAAARWTFNIPREIETEFDGRGNKGIKLKVCHLFQLLWASGPVALPQLCPVSVIRSNFNATTVRT